MQLNEEKKDKNTKVSKILITSIIVTIVIIILLIIAIIYVLQNAGKKVAIIDGEKNSKFFELIRFEKDDNGEEYMLFPIKEVAQYLGYKAYNGEYKNATEDKDKCYIKWESKKSGSENLEEKEVANFELDSNIISKIDLTKNNIEYEYYELDKKIRKIDGTLYTTINGLETAFNVYFKYNAENQNITIYTLEYLNNFYTKKIANGEYKGYKKIATDVLNNEKALLEDMIIVQDENDKYGAIYARRWKNNIRTKI